MAPPGSGRASSAALSRASSDWRAAVGAEPLPRDRPVGGGGWRDGACRAGCWAVSDHGGGDARLNRGARPGRGETCYGDRQGDVGDARGRRLRSRAVAAALVLVLGAGGCGGGAQLQVSAASSLKGAFTSYGPSVHARPFFAGY